MDRLLSLRLQKCRNTPAFLAGLANSGHQIRLHTLEVVLTLDYDDDCEENLGKFLETFQSLQELYIQITYSGDTYSGVSQSIFSHRASLRRLVYHERQKLSLDSDDDYGSYEDNDNYQHQLGYTQVGVDPDQDITPFAREDFYKLLRGTSLECVGFCERPSALVCIKRLKFWFWESISLTDFWYRRFNFKKRMWDSNGNYCIFVRAKAQLIYKAQNWSTVWNFVSYILSSQRLGKRYLTRIDPTILANFQYPVITLSDEEEILLFAEWAFGPQGLQNLLILAYGNFTDREGSRNYLFCRDLDKSYGATFRKISTEDNYVWDLVPGAESMLRECIGFA